MNEFGLKYGNTLTVNKRTICVVEESAILLADENATLMVFL